MWGLKRWLCEEVVAGHEECLADLDLATLADTQPPRGYERS